MTGLGDEGRLLGRGIAFPFRLGADGRVAVSAGAENIRESIRVILSTDPGERLMRPAFGVGLRSFLFEPNIPSTHRLIEERVTTALGRWEPRIRVANVGVEEDPDEPRQANVAIEYALVATGERSQVDLAVRLGA
jgi:phage baseplate assembly protein W